MSHMSMSSSLLLVECMLMLNHVVPQEAESVVAASRKAAEEVAILIWNIETTLIWNIEAIFIWNIETILIWNIETILIRNIETIFI